MNETGLAVLIVDDEEMIRQVLSIILTEAGHAIREADSGHRALAAAREQPFDVAIVDLRMPGMDGIATLDGLRAIDPEMPVVILTGEGSVESAIQALRHGACEFLEKPIGQDVLLRAIDRAVERNRLEGMAALVEAQHSLTESWTGPEVARQIPERARDVLPADYVLLARAGDDDSRAEDTTSGERGSSLARLAAEAAARCARHGASVHWPATAEGPAARPHAPSSLPSPSVMLAGESVIAYPLIPRDCILGSLVFVRSTASRIFSVREFHRGARLAREVAMGLENARLNADLEARMRELAEAREMLERKEKLAHARTGLP